MKEEDLRQEAYKECKKSQQRETMMYFAIIAVTGTLIGFALVPVHFLLGCGLGLFLIALACYFARAIWKQHQTGLHAVAQGILAEAEVVGLKEEKDSDGQGIRLFLDGRYFGAGTGGGQTSHIR